jgi:hypothetical protein
MMHNLSSCSRCTSHVPKAHVAGTLVGRKSSNGSTESDGGADGVAKGAKLAMFDIGRYFCGAVNTSHDCRGCQSLTFKMYLFLFLNSLQCPTWRQFSRRSINQPVPRYTLLPGEPIKMRTLPWIELLTNSCTDVLCLFFSPLYFVFSHQVLSRFCRYENPDFLFIVAAVRDCRCACFIRMFMVIVKNS